MGRQRGTWGLILAGIGLIVLGGASALFLRNRLVQDTQQPTDFSAVPADVEFQAPVLVLNDLADEPHALSDYVGQVVLVNIWATWCPPCKAEMPGLQAFFDKHRGEGFTVIAIEDGDPAVEVRDFVKSYGLTFPVWLDPGNVASEQAFKTINLPTSYVIDRAGTVRLFWLGAISQTNLEKYVAPLIQER